LKLRPPNFPQGQIQGMLYLIVLEFSQNQASCAYNSAYKKACIKKSAKLLISIK